MEDNIVKMEILLKLTYRVNVIPTKTPTSFYRRNWYADPKIYM